MVQRTEGEIDAGWAETVQVPITLNILISPLSIKRPSLREIKQSL